MNAMESYRNAERLAKEIIEMCTEKRNHIKRIANAKNRSADRY